MENKNHGARVFWIVLAGLAAATVALALIIRTEKRLLCLLARVEKFLPVKVKKADPITVEL